MVIFLKIKNNNNNSLLNVRFGSLLGLYGLLLIYMGRKLYLRKPYNPSPHLLELTYKAPTGRLRVTCGALLPYFLTSLGTTTAVISLRTR